MIARRELVESLREQVRRIETAGRPEGQLVSLGCESLDAILPQRGISRGTIHEWLAPCGGHGAEILSLMAAREACRSGGALVVIDSLGCFYPPAAALWDIDLQNTIVIRPENQRDAAWAIDQALACPAVAAVWGYVDVIGERWLRRFQLSAEQSGCLGLFVRPESVRGRPTWSESQWRCRGMAEDPLPDPPHAARGREQEIGSGLFQRQTPDHLTLRTMPGYPSPSQRALSRNLFSTSREAISVPSLALNNSLALSHAPSNSPIPSPSWGGLGRGAATPSPIARGEDRWIQVRLARLRGGAAGASLTLRIDFQTGSAQATRWNDEANRVRLSRRLADPAVGRRAARA